MSCHDAKKLLSSSSSKSFIQKITLQDDSTIVKSITQFVLAGMKQTIPREKVTEELRELLAVDPGRFGSLLSDAWASIDCLSSCRGNDGVARREIFLQITQDLTNQMFYLFQEKSDTELLPDLGIMTSSEVKFFNQKTIRLKTRTYYKQQKFNLCREEPEGYGKLIAELARPLDQISPGYMLNVIHSLIGRCYLDPNRVVDIVLEAFECQPNSDFFVPLLKNLDPNQNTICEIIAFKLDNIDSTRTIFNLIALLLQHSIIKLDSIYPWLKPDNRVIEKNWEREINEAIEYAGLAMKVRLDGKEANGGNPDEDDDIIEDRSAHHDNHKLLLCKALLDIGAWGVAKDLIDRHPKFSFTSCAMVARSLVRLYNYLIDPIYNTISELPGWKKVKKPYHLTPNLITPNQIYDYDELAVSLEMIIALGPYIHCDPVLIYKILRLMKFYLNGVQGKTKTDIYYVFIDVLDEAILPSLCYMDGNCAIAREVWTVMDAYPYYIRFRIYGSWKSEDKARLHPTLLRRRVDVLKTVKGLMRRLSKENVKFMGRQLGKLSHSIPAIVFDYILSQIQLFDNLIIPVIDALKYLSPLGYDMLGYCLLEALSPADIPNKKATGLTVMLTANRPRTKHDGSTIAPWIQNLATFTGTICKKYGVDIVPILQYVVNQLKSLESLDLLLLKEIVQKMTGIEAAEDVTPEQLQAMSGGELIKSEAGYFGQLRTAKKSATRLREAASQNDLAISLCILMAQQRNRIIYDESQGELHNKLVGKLYDQCQDTLVQFGSFLASSCTLDEYTKKIPHLQKLVEDYHVDCDVAFFLWRPIFTHLVTTKYDELRRAGKGHRKLSPNQLQQCFALASGGVLDPTIEIIRNFLPPKTWEDISPQFFVTFWSLTLYDLCVPNDAYAREVARVKQISIAAGENKEYTSSKRRKENERCNLLIEKLLDEQKRQEEHVKRVLAKLGAEKDTWFTPRAQKSAKNEAVTAFLQLCIFPRCVFTAPDALYCAQFVTTIHSLSTPNFSTLICYDRVFCDIIYTVTSCTENEANRYGTFLNALLTTVMKWHGDKEIFEKECASFPGFVTKFRATNSSAADANDHVDYENFRHVCHKWHYKITKCIIVCLESKDFTQIRNALIVLKRVLPSFPRVLNLANAIERWVERVRAEQKEKRHDLFALATSYIGQLKAKLPTFIPEDIFHNKSTPDKTSGTGDGKVSKQSNDTKTGKSDTTLKTTKSNSDSSKNSESRSNLEDVGSPAPISAKEDVKSPKHILLGKDDGKIVKLETKTVKIKTSDIGKVDANGSEKVKVSRKLDSKDKEPKRRRVEEKEGRSSSISPSVNSTKRYSSKK